ncbi:peptidyl-tRNA hydrolase, PTH1 family [Geosmithia morbida]|uniref:peptidyl-tRNA hydrolase n=1 Tax=Geosmithia morbida TaxID=1094350 RepID=A0A9P5D2X6_9HYPO|nr:peptidyl-tRNA hydrolase, PTH1 family [Geosmithia morbida]KAF4121936.1 peptidyl-tRNA hydrolase, PTH1 family [Geosmithia morbida]
MGVFNPHFLVVSLGNPLPKYSSLHSAGHYVLKGLAKVVGQPDYQPTKLGKQTCLVSQGPKYTMVQSPTLMNVSGGFVARAWQEMARQHDPASLSLVLVHDELEKDFGIVRLVAWDRSHRGHNGIKSVRSSVTQSKYPESPLARIAVGIGRPDERDAATVSRYVLAPIGAEKIQELQTSVAREVATKLRELEDEWASELSK